MSAILSNRKIIMQALSQQPTNSSFWLDVVHGIGLAIDPLPAPRPPTFCKNDRSVFAADLIKLVCDRDIAVSKLMKIEYYHNTIFDNLKEKNNIKYHSPFKKNKNGKAAFATAKDR